MSKPKLDTDRLRSELSESAFFRKPAKQQRSDVKEQHPDISNASATDRPSGRVSQRRMTRRVSFEYYVDQMDRLKKLSLEEQLQGGKGNMSEMVREAVDDYLSRRSRGEG